jgi:hypothetical protein
MMTLAEFKEVYGSNSDTNLKKGLTKAAFERIKRWRARDEAKYKKKVGDAVYTKIKEEQGCYLDRIPWPEDVPAGVAIVHNNMRFAGKGRMIGPNGFRIWAQRLEDSEPPIEVCTCNWAPELERHYRATRD